MRTLAKAMLSALVLAGAGAAIAALADARVSVGIGAGVPAYAAPVYAYPDCAYPLPYGYPPDYCAYPASYAGYPEYYGPVFIDGFWYDGPFHHRAWHGRDQFWFHGGWHEGRMGSGHHWHHSVLAGTN